MSNPTLDLIHTHGSVRAYKSDPVPDAMLEQIIDAAQRASTSSNLQTYSVVAVTDVGQSTGAAKCGGRGIAPKRCRATPAFDFVFEFHERAHRRGDAH